MTRWLNDSLGHSFNHLHLLINAYSFQYFSYFWKYRSNWEGQMKVLSFYGEFNDVYFSLKCIKTIQKLKRSNIWIFSDTTMKRVVCWRGEISYSSWNHFIFLFWDWDPLKKLDISFLSSWLAKSHTLYWTLKFMKKFW